MFDKFSWYVVYAGGFLCLQHSDCLFYFCSEKGRISVFILRRCSEDVVICVQFVVVEFFAVLGPSPRYCIFPVIGVPFLSSIFDDRLDLFGDGFQHGISLSGTLHPSLYFNELFVYPVVLCFPQSFYDFYLKLVFCIVCAFLLW